MILNNIFYAAGVLFYTKTYDNNVYFLLGKDNNNKWADFGGGAEICDKYETTTTAAREAWEETLGCVYDYEFLRMKIKQSGNFVTSKTYSGKQYYMYLVYIPYSNVYREKFTSTKKFINRINIPENFLEINDIKWVSIDTIKSYIQEGSNLIKFKTVFANNFDKNNLEIIKIISEKF